MATGLAFDLTLQLAPVLHPARGQFASGERGEDRAARLVSVGSSRRIDTAGPVRRCRRTCVQGLRSRRKTRGTDARDVDDRPATGSGIRARWVVVCRPRPSARRIGWVAITMAPASALTNVDFPAPEAPSSPSVRPCGQGAQSCSRPARRRAHTEHLHVRARSRLTSSTITCGSGARSTLVSRRPVVHRIPRPARAAVRSGRGRAPDPPVQRQRSVSTLAARIWPSASAPAEARTTAVRRGRTASMVVARRATSAAPPSHQHTEVWSGHVPPPRAVPPPTLARWVPPRRGRYRRHGPPWSPGRAVDRVGRWRTYAD